MKARKTALTRGNRSGNTEPRRTQSEAEEGGGEKRRKKQHGQPALPRALPVAQILLEGFWELRRNFAGYAAVAALLMLKGLPILLALFVGLFAGIGLPHFVVGKVIKKRIAKFNAKFPDAIELLVRGLRSGLPISETMGVVGAEVGGPVGEEFRAVVDKMKIGRTMDVALQETADRLGTPEFQFFCITIAIQRETGGNLAETLQIGRAHV